MNIIAETHLYIIVPSISPRIKFVLDHLSRLSGWNIQAVTTDKAKPSIPILTYGMSVEGAPRLGQAYNWLLKEGSIPIYRPSRVASCWQVTDDVIGLDLFQAVFYHLTRIEEIQQDSKDRYGRFLSSTLHDEDKEQISTPFLDQWIKRWLDKVREMYPRLPEVEWNLEVLPSYDIDYPYMFHHHKPSVKLRKLAGLIGRGGFESLRQLIRGKDPFDTFGRITQDVLDYKLDPNFFILVGNKLMKEDQTLSIEDGAYQKLIKRLASLGRISWHPSLSSVDDVGLLFAERQMIEKLIAGAGLRTRFHYLKVDYPSRYRHLSKMRVKEDHSMGFADAVGFRVGTAHPFYFYDIAEETRTALMLYPLHIMDATMRFYQKWSPDEAINRIHDLHNQSKETGGKISWVWHNSSLGPVFGWKEWDKVYRCLLELS